MRAAKSCGPDAPVLASRLRVRNRKRWWHSMATREITYKSWSHCAGKAGVFPLNLYARVPVFQSIKCTRDRGCSAHPVFPAPSLEGRVRLSFEARANLKTSDKIMSRERERIFIRRPGPRAGTHTALMALSSASTTTRRVMGPGSRPGRRDCEPTGRANARPMINSAKQSRATDGALDCFANAARNDGEPKSSARRDRCRR